MKIGVVIPTYEEQNNIKKIYRAFKKIKKIDFFFCFVDGSFTSRTSDEIKKIFEEKNYKILYEKNKSKIGILSLSTRCKASFIGFNWLVKNKKLNLISDMDADLSSNPKDIKKAINLFLKYNSDLIIGSKYLDKSRVLNRNLSRSIFSYIYTGVCKLLISNKISDYSAGYRFYKPSSLKKMIKKKLYYKSPAQHLENLLFYFENGYKISEFPAIYIDTKRNSKSIIITHIIIYVLQLCIILFRFMFRKIKKFSK